MKKNLQRFQKDAITVGGTGITLGVLSELPGAGPVVAPFSSSLGSVAHVAIAGNILDMARKFSKKGKY